MRGILYAMLLAAAGVVIWTAPASAQTIFYVAINGNDSNPCTQAQPCRTVGRAHTVATTGSIIQVAPSGTTYNEYVIITKSITLRGHNGSGCPETFLNSIHSRGARSNPGVTIEQGISVRASNVTIECIKMHRDGIAIEGSGRFNIKMYDNYIDGSPYVSGFNGTCGVGFWTDVPSSSSGWPTNIHWARNYVTRCQYGAILHSNDSLFEFNEIERPGPAPGNDDNDYIRIFGTGNTYRGNYMHGARVGDCQGDCHIDCFQTYNVTGAAFSILRNSVIEQNSCAGAHQGIIMQDIADSGSHVGITVRNNIFFPASFDSSMSWCVLFENISNVTFYHNVCGGTGATGYRNGTTATHRNNVHYSCGYNPYIITGSSVIRSNNIIYEQKRTYSAGSFPGDIVNVNPLFMNPSADDYRLQLGSPAIDAAMDVGVINDRHGYQRPRGDGPDIGAFEFGSLLSPPRNLRVIVP